MARVRELRTFAAIEFAWAVNARRATVSAVGRVLAAGGHLFDHHRRAAGAGAGRDPLRRARRGQPSGPPRRLAAAGRGAAVRGAPLLVPWSEGGLAEAPSPHAEAVVVPMPVAPSGAGGERDIAAITYGANPEKKGLDRVLAAWLAAGRAGEELVVAGLDERRARSGCARAAVRAARPARGVRFAGMLSRAEYRALLRRSRVFVTAPRREDYGIAQLEALADGCVLVTTPAPGPYAALPRRARARSAARGATSSRSGPRSTTPLARLRGARGRSALEAWTRRAVDRVVAEQLLPRLLA